MLYSRKKLFLGNNNKKIRKRNEKKKKREKLETATYPSRMCLHACVQAHCETLTQRRVLVGVGEMEYRTQTSLGFQKYLKNPYPPGVLGVRELLEITGGSCSLKC